MSRPASIPLELRLPIELDDLVSGPRPGATTPAPGTTAASRCDSWAARVSGGVASGDHGALDELYRDWFDRALALARTWSRRDEAFCLDAVQNTMLKAVRSIRPLPTLAALDGWMTTAVRSSVIDALRREARRAARERRARAGGDSTARTQPPPTGAELESIHAAILELTADQQHLLRSRFVAGDTLGRIAEELGATVGAVHGKLRRAVDSLRQKLKESPRDPR